MADVDDATTPTALVATPTASPEKKNFTERDLVILANAWKCLKAPPEVDVNKLAEMCGMTNPRSAANAWIGIKKKLLGPITPTPSPTKAAKVAKVAKAVKADAPKNTKAARKRAASEIQDENADSDGAAEQTPPKKTRRAAVKKAAMPKASTKKPVKKEVKAEEEEVKSEQEEVKTDVDSVKDEFIEEDKADCDSD